MRARLYRSVFAPILVAACGTGCEPAPPSVAPKPTSSSAPAAASATTTASPSGHAAFNQVTRADFNRVAIERNLPFFWIADANKDGALDPNELAFVRMAPRAATLPSEDELEAAVASFSPKLEAWMYAPIATHAKNSGKSSPRMDSLLRELGQSRPTLLYTDLSSPALAPWEPFMRIMLRVGTELDALYEKQIGVFGLDAKIAPDDTVSRAVFFRNHGPACVAPATQGAAECTAIEGLPKTPRSTLYEPSMLESKTFCDELQKSTRKTAKDPYHVVRYDGDKRFIGIPYHIAYKAELESLATLLTSAASAIPDASETALREYLSAQAKAFRDGSWFQADEAWARMNAQNSKWYVRASADETYGEPCNTKALFHLSFGLINQKSVFWQNKLDPRKTEMEAELTALAGAPYQARKVTFKLPDFMDVALNAGDARAPSGGTIGQSLPNFGPVANEGRGRTVAMTNLYLDPDGIASIREAASSLLCTSAMDLFSDSQDPQLMSTVLHEAAHNLGPAHQYKVKDKIDREVFGGPLASMLEELKAQTAALYFTDWLASKGEATPSDAQKAHVRDLVWAFGHISRGMYEGSGQSKGYSQLAAIQVSHLMREHVLAWSAESTAANGKDKGCFTIDMPAFAPAAKKLMIEVAGVKARGDKPRAASWVKENVDCGVSPSDHAKGRLPPLPAKPQTGCDVMGTISARMLRQPKPSFLYGVKFAPKK